MIVFSTTTLIYLFKFFTGHWQKPLCGRISDGWRKRRKWKLKIVFIFPPPPYTSCFLLFFDRELVWPRSSNFDNVEDNTTYYTHYIRWIIEPKSKQNYLLLHTTKTEKRNEKTWCLPWRKKIKKRIAKVYKKLIFFLFDDFSVYSKVEFTLRKFLNLNIHTFSSTLPLKRTFVIKD